MKTYNIPNHSRIFRFIPVVIIGLFLFLVSMESIKLSSRPTYIEIDKTSSVRLKVDQFEYSRGYLLFNDSLLISSSKFKENSFFMNFEDNQYNIDSIYGMDTTLFFIVCADTTVQLTYK